MSWRSRLRPASFRGVSFYVDEADGQYGRRLVVHEYPLRDDPYVEDLGRKARQFTITAYVLGEEYQTGRDALIDACEKPGAGTLVHPYRGSQQVCCANISVRESRTEGGIAFLSIEFIQAGLQQFPAGRTSPLSAIGLASGGLVEAARANFTGLVTVSGVSDFVRAAFGGTVSDIGGLFSSLQNSGGILQSLGGQDLINEAAAFTGLIAQMKGAALSFIGSPGGVADAMQQLFSSLGRLSLGPQAAVSNYRATRALQVITRPEVTAFAALENRNKTATKRFNDLLSLAQEAQYLPRVPYASHEEATAARDLFLVDLDGQAATATGDDEFTALQALRAEVARAVPGSDQALPRLRQITLNSTQPSLVVAYDLYEDAGREAEIALRNKQRHPGFLRADKPLEVLSA